MNGDADTDLPDALRSRFPVRFRIEEVHPQAIARLPKDLQSIAKRTGETKEVDVKTGISEGSYIEVKTGLQGGEVVIVEVDKQK